MQVIETVNAGLASRSMRVSGDGDVLGGRMGGRGGEEGREWCGVGVVLVLWALGWESGVAFYEYRNGLARAPGGRVLRG